MSCRVKENGVHISQTKGGGNWYLYQIKRPEKQIKTSQDQSNQPRTHLTLSVNKARFTFMYKVLCLNNIHQSKEGGLPLIMKIFFYKKVEVILSCISLGKQTNVSQPKDHWNYNWKNNVCNKVVIELWSIVMLLWCFHNLARTKGIDYTEWNMYHEHAQTNNQERVTKPLIHLD